MKLVFLSFLSFSFFIILLKGQIVINFGSLGSDSQEAPSSIFVGNPGGQSNTIFQSTIIETNTYVDADGVAHTKTIETTTNQDANGNIKTVKKTTDQVNKENNGKDTNIGFGIPTDFFAFPTNIFQQMNDLRNQLFGDIFGTHPRTAGRSSLRGPSHSQKDEDSSVVIKLVSDDKAPEQIDNTSDAHNPDLTKPMITTDIEHVHKSGTLPNDDNSEEDVKKEGGQKDSDDSSAMLIESKREGRNIGMDTKTFDRYFMLVLLAFILAVLFFLRRIQVCRKEFKAKKFCPPTVDMKKRED